MQNNASDLVTWLNTRPYWTQEAARRLQKIAVLAVSDHKELTELCKKPPASPPKLASEALRFTAVSNAITLKSVSEPKGIDELSPKKSLNFNDKLTIIYGTNGSGKSGYIRILKRICGARMSKELIGSVFLPTPAIQSCKIGYLYNGAAHALKPIKVINTLLNERVPQAKKIYDEKGSAAYAPEAKGICSDLRITLERLVECTLLNEVILRFRRSVTTKGRLSKLAKIGPDDCKMIDDLMTEYSKYEHSQPGEAPVTPPLPAKLDADLKKLKAWHEEFIKR
jgi:hypothetical protein